MKPDYPTVLTAAMALDKRGRRKLREELHETLAPRRAEEDWSDFDWPASSIEGLSHTEMIAEFDRRFEEALRDPSVMIPFEVFKREMLEEIAHGTRTPSPGITQLSASRS